VGSARGEQGEARTSLGAEQAVSSGSDAGSAADASLGDGASPVTRRSAKALLKNGHKLLRRGRKKLERRRVSEISDALSALELALREGEGEQVALAFAKVESLLERHLSFAQKGTLREIVECVVFALLFAFIVRALIVEPFKIPTRSMVPTLMDGDHLFVNKFAYGIRVPLTTHYLISFREPARGEVVVFVFPREQAAAHIAMHGRDCLDQASLAEEKDYIKRVIGVPGDEVQVINQVVHVNGEPVTRTPLYRREVSQNLFPIERRTEEWSEESLGDAKYLTISHPSAHSSFGPVKVKDGHVFVMGDNRDNSSDSRCWGQVPIENIKGKAMVIWWSIGSQGPRWTRLFNLIE